MSAGASSAVRVQARACRWICPAGWVRRAEWTSEDPPALWGQDRVVEALDRFAASLTSGGRPVHLDLIRVPGSDPCIEDIAAAMERRLGHGAVRALGHPTEAALRGSSEAPALSDPRLSVVILEARDIAVDRARMDAVLELLELGAVTPLPSDGGLAPAPRSAPGLVLLGDDNARKPLRDVAPHLDDLFDERVVFVPDLPRTPGGAATVVARLKAIGEARGAGPVSQPALAFLIEELAGRPARRDRIALDVRSCGAALVEARRLRGDDAPLRAADVRRAWGRLRWRAGASEEAHRARLALAQLAVQSEGRVVGVANGLLVYGSGSSSYSVPGRMTARVGVGRHEIVNVEREAKYSGRSFDKGVFQLTSWLRATFARDSHPIGMSASLAFEQSYGKIDGDSATLAEAIALLSELSGLPARQDIAVTGAVSQRGELLPVGSVNLKVRGWWSTCRDRGPLTGTQGVLLPAVSAADLQLDPAVLADVMAERFHVWVADDVGQAAELLLGRPSGAERPRPKGSVFALAEARMGRMSERLYPQRRAPAPPPTAPQALPPPQAASGDGDDEGA